MGKTDQPSFEAVRTADHPHGRGENGAPSSRRSPSCGSSPRAWGKLRRSRCRAAGGRIIPTGVGKTTIFTPNASIIPDHPHGRGENDELLSVEQSSNGSSPRAWGKPTRTSPKPSRKRIIPTGVGKTSSLRTWLLHLPDHPHGRGENLHSSSPHGKPTGSSPRAWGKLIEVVSVPKDSRIIPTGVGKTCRDRRERTRASDHPHGRGENGLRLADP